MIDPHFFFRILGKDRLFIMLLYILITHLLWMFIYIYIYIMVTALKESTLPDHSLLPANIYVI